MNRDPKEMWNERYETPGKAYGMEPNDFIREHASQIRPGGSVLGIAEGEGRNGCYLAEKGHKVTVVDLSDVAIENCKKYAQQKGLTIAAITANLAEFDIGENKWDAVVSVWAHMPKPLRKKVHADIVKGLKKGGVLLLEAYNPNQLKHKTGGPPVADLLMSLEDLKEEFNGLEFLYAEEKERMLKEGAHHNGLSAVVQIFARKK